MQVSMCSVCWTNTCLCTPATAIVAGVELLMSLTRHLRSIAGRATPLTMRPVHSDARGKDLLCMDVTRSSGAQTHCVNSSQDVDLVSRTVNTVSWTLQSGQTGAVSWLQNDQSCIRAHNCSDLKRRLPRNFQLLGASNTLRSGMIRNGQGRCRQMLRVCDALCIDYHENERLVGQHDHL